MLFRSPCIEAILNGKAVSTQIQRMFSSFSNICQNVTYHEQENLYTQRAHGVIMTSLLRQNDVATSFWRNDDVISVSCVRWV